MKTLRRTLLPALLMALTLTAQAGETVYLTPKGKTFHKVQTCMALSRATTVYTAERDAAVKHGLHQCGICYRVVTRHQQLPKAVANDWAKPVKK